jgi:hypothetical protein
MQQPPPPPPSAPAAPHQPYGYAQPSGWTPPPPVSPRRWWIWACGGCGALALVAIAVAVFVFVHIFTSSPLRQFPTEAGASTARDDFTSANDHTTETLQIVDPHALLDVETYYQQALHTNGWTTDTHDPAQAASGDAWTFSRSGSPAQSGTITFTTAGSGTDIAVVFNY